jgi:hypothetical protein
VIRIPGVNLEILDQYLPAEFRSLTANGGLQQLFATSPIAIDIFLLGPQTRIYVVFIGPFGTWELSFAKISRRSTSWHFFTEERLKEGPLISITV